MQTERKKAGKKSLCLMLAILMLLGTLLSIHSDKQTNKTNRDRSITFLLITQVQHR